MYKVELPEVHTISPDPVLYVKNHNHGNTSSKNFSVSTKLAFYLLRQSVPAVRLSVIRITWCCDIDVLVHRHCGRNMGQELRATKQRRMIWRRVCSLVSVHGEEGKKSVVCFAIKSFQLKNLYILKQNIDVWMTGMYIFRKKVWTVYKENCT